MVENKSEVVCDASAVVPSIIWLVVESGSVLDLSVVESNCGADVVGTSGGAVDDPASLEVVLLKTSVPAALVDVVVSCPGTAVQVASSVTTVCSVVSVKFPPSSTDCVISEEGTSVVVLESEVVVVSI